MLGLVLALAIVAGVLIGGLGASPNHSLAAEWKPPTEAELQQTILTIQTPIPTLRPTNTPTPRPTARPKTTPTPRATAAAPQPTATVAAPVEPTPAITPEIAGPPAPTELPYVEYVVQRGDILKLIASRFNTTIEAIRVLNPGINPDSLTVGATLRIPRVQ